MFLVTPVKKATRLIGVLVWDISLTFINLVTPNRKEGHVTPEGHPGVGGVWPEFVAPRDGDSRCCCPALNAMANHGILPHDGRNISFKELNRTIRATFNFAPTFCFLVPNVAADMLKKSYSKDTFDLEELNLHNGIEHDASLTREDVHFQADQGVPHLPFIKELLASATGKDKDGNPLLTPTDLSRISAQRRVDARATNPEFSLSFSHKMFGSSNSSTMLTIFGGRIRDLETILIEERLPEGWESRIRERQGLTLVTFNRTVLGVEFGINEKKVVPTPAAHSDDAARPSTQKDGADAAQL
ncbi:Chloroperoxidase [Collybia nuda]|uniref:Chloroperoxidase n=1 Tax=Collybia nuda TaxID=64659 RepID=A0A9P6CID5_9AGAR|nr:Chloroperoxidase [Collybia nuda]